MFILRIYLMGLVALVPHIDGDNSLALVLPASRSHLPAVVFPCPSGPALCDLDAPSIAYDLGITTNLDSDGLLAFEDERFGAMELDGAVLSLSTPAKPDARHELVFASGRVSRASDVTGSVPETSHEARAFDWVPRVAAVFPDHGSLRGSLSDLHKQGVIASYLELRNVRGVASVYALTEMGQMIPAFRFRVFHSFGGYRSVIRQAVAEVVIVDLEMEGAAAELKVQRKDGCHSVALTPVDGRAEILIGNLAPFGFYSGNSLPHFKMYFPLTGAEPGSMEEPMATGKEVSESEVFSEVPMRSQPVPDIAATVSYQPKLQSSTGREGRRSVPFDGYARELCTLAVVNPQKP